MRTEEAANALRRVGDFEFQGDPDARIGGVTNGARSGGLKYQYGVLIDENWRGGAADRLRVDWETLPERVERATKHGITGFLCNREFAKHPALEGHNVFSGPDARDLFYRLGEILRDSRGPSKIAAVTGSAGKTTTKRMLAHALQAVGRSGRVAAAPQSFNVATEALKYLSRAPQSAFSVVEMAGVAFPEFRRRGFTASADVSIVTSISEAHLIAHKTLEQIAHDKSGIFDRPPAGGTAVINLDTAHAEILLQRATDQGCQIVTYGESEHASMRLLHYNPQTGEVSAWVGGETLNYVVGARGKQMALNSLAVIASLRSFRLPDWRVGVESLAQFEALPGRGQVSQVSRHTGGSVTVIDESYNANPESMRAALETHQGPRRDGRLVLVFGDMLELGDNSNALHAGLAPNVVNVSPDAVHLFGEQMAHLHRSLQGAGYEASSHWDDLEELCRAVQTDLQDGDTVLVKSSNGMRLRELVTRLQETKG